MLKSLVSDQTQSDLQSMGQICVQGGLSLKNGGRILHVQDISVAFTQTLKGSKNCYEITRQSCQRSCMHTASVSVHVDRDFFVKKIFAVRK